MVTREVAANGGRARLPGLGRHQGRASRPRPKPTKLAPSGCVAEVTDG